MSKIKETFYQKLRGVIYTTILDERSPIKMNEEEVGKLNNLIIDIMELVSRAKNKEEGNKSKIICLDCDTVLLEVFGQGSVLHNVSVTCPDCGTNYQIKNRE